MDVATVSEFVFNVSVFPYSWPLGLGQKAMAQD